MIHIERGPAPKFMESPEFSRLREQYFQFRSHGGTAETQARFDVDRDLAEWESDIWDALYRQFDGRCAYTGRPLIAGDETWSAEPRKARGSGRPGGPSLTAFGGRVLHRPAENASSLDGIVDPDHYWWLALEWGNWYLASHHVRSAKSTVFPVRGERLADGAPLPGDEEPLILDPCRDWPSWWLRFDADGHVAPRNLLDPDGTLDRGGATISVLGLQSEHLVEIRRYRAGVLRGVKLLTEEVRSTDPRLPGLSAQLLARRCIADSSVSSKAFAAAAEALMHRCPDALAAEFFEHSRSYGRAKREALRPLLDHVAAVATGLAEAFDAGTSHAARPGAPAAAKPREPAAHAPARVRAGDQIARVRVRNFRAIHEVDLTLNTDLREIPPEYGSGESRVDGRGWTVLLGENGSGKSSLLQSIALALAGRGIFDLERRGLIRWNDLLRRADDVEDGSIVLDFVGGGQVTLRFDADSAHFEGFPPGDGPILPVNCRAYGATRLMAERGTPRPGAGTSAATTQVVGNLFDPRETVLVDAGQLLLSLDPSSFNLAARSLTELLESRRRPDDIGTQRVSRITIEDGELLVDDDPLSLASDGYRTVIALAADVMAGIGGLGPDESHTADIRQSSGIVLVDEIGAHLHPRWRMEITAKLRRTFPSVQFIVTTHEPLCLRGLQEGEVVRVYKDREDGVTAEVIDRSPGAYRVDQLLTSEYFGLASAIDPDLDRKFQRYYQLRLRGEARTEDERLEFERLDIELNEETRLALGYTRRGQLIFEAIDDFMSRRDGMKVAERRTRRAEVISEVRDIWQSLDRMMPGAGP